jgi:PiT family inorganic phosphate transporter
VPSSALATLHPELAADTLAGPNGAIVGVGAARKVAAVRWNVASNVVVAWVLTLPAAALFGAIFYSFYRFVS